jgi:hypothetical protein
MLISPSPWAQVAGWHLSQILPWICLLLVLSMTAYGFQLGVPSMLPSPAVDQVDVDYRTLDSPGIREPRGAFPQAASASATRTILIAVLDTASGDRTQMECVAATDRYPEDVLLVELKDFRAVTAQLCRASDAAGFGR